jgi:hypothetical protein
MRRATRCSRACAATDRIAGMSHRFDPVILREYDVRGTVGTNLSAADAYAVGRSFATRLRRAGGTSVAVGYDGRTHSPALEAALVRGLSEGGVDVVRVGLGPSPKKLSPRSTSLKPLSSRGLWLPVTCTPPSTPSVAAA